MGSHARSVIDISSHLQRIIRVATDAGCVVGDADHVVGVAPHARDVVRVPAAGFHDDADNAQPGDEDPLPYCPRRQ